VSKTSFKQSPPIKCDSEPTATNERRRGRERKKKKRFKTAELILVEGSNVLEVNTRT